MDNSTSNSTPSLPPRGGAHAILSSLRTKAAVGAVTFVLFLVTVIGLVITRHERLALTREVELRVLAQARGVATSSERIMLEPDPELTFQKLLRETMAHDADIQSIVVVDQNGLILAHPEVTRIGKPYTSPPGLISLAEEGDLAEEETITEDEDMLLVSVPITRMFEGQVLTVGRVYISSAKTKITSAIRSASLQVLAIAVFVSLLGSIVGVIISGFITTPIKKLAEGARRIGEGDFSVRMDVAGRDEIGQLSNTLNEMASRLNAARSQIVEKERMARELEIARDIQLSLLPQSFPEMEQVQVAAVCKSAYEVGGDYFDLITIDGRRVGIVIADVAGKGVPGLLVMGVVRSVIRAQARQHLSPREVLIRANDIITPDIHRGMFVTVFYGVLDVERRTFTFANAGHNPLIVLKRDGSSPYDIRKTQGRPVGFMVGPFFDDRLEETNLTLADGDTIFAYTDGVLDAFDSQNEEFGMNRLLETLLDHRHEAPQAIVDAVIGALASFAGEGQQQDDITLLAVSLQPTAADHEIPPPADEPPARDAAPTPTLENGPPVADATE